MATPREQFIAEAGARMRQRCLASALDPRYVWLRMPRREAAEFIGSDAKLQEWVDCTWDQTNEALDNIDAGLPDWAAYPDYVVAVRFLREVLTDCRRLRSEATA